jgi:CHAD domain-containing protein
MDAGLSLKSFQPKSQDISRKPRIGQRRVNPELARLVELTAKLKENLSLCATPEGTAAKNHEPAVDTVHDVRTGTRRIEAVLESIQRSMPEIESRASADARNAANNTGGAREAIARWQRLLKKIRRSAGTVRDLDVHRGLLADLLKDRARQVDEKHETPEPHAARGSTVAPGSKQSPETATESNLEQGSVRSSSTQGSTAAPAFRHSPEGTAENSPARSAGSSHRKQSSPEGTTEHHSTPLQKQAEDLDAWLKHIRHEHSQPLMAGAKKWANKLDGHLHAIREAMPPAPGRARTASPATTALDAFARLSVEMQQLYADNLHDFRKGAKKARYMAETAKDDEYAGSVGKALKKLQDEIGDWHDWLVLAEEAHRALGDHGDELIAHIEQQRDRHYAGALKTAERMRGRLMGEWRAAASKPQLTARPGSL